MTDVGATIAPKSDQLNADDLITGSRVIRITKVSANPGSAEQPISIYFEDDNGKPYKPCKSMRRVLVQVWGQGGAEYVGREMTLFRDPLVMFGGVAVGGIRISHMSHIDKPVTLALTANRASRKPYTVEPLASSHASTPPREKKKANGNASLPDRASAFAGAIDGAETLDDERAVWARGDALRTELQQKEPDIYARVFSAHMKRFKELGGKS